MVKVKKDQGTEQKILAAARSIFLEKGMDGARMQEIADRAGINKALLHYYFRNKEKLFETVFTEAMSGFIPKLHLIVAGDAPLFEKITLFVNEYISMLQKNPYLPLFILNEVNKQPKSIIYKVWGEKRPPFKLFIQHIEAEVKKGVIKPIEPVHLISNMVSMCIFPFLSRPLMQWVTETSDEDYRQFIEKRKTEVPKFIIDSIRK